MIKMCLLILSLLVLRHPPTFSQDAVLHVRVTDELSQKVIPVMVCITNIGTGKVHIPPHGDTAPPATYPEPFFTGINYSADNNWVGPLRKMSGKGAINGQRTYVYGNNPSVPGWKEPLMYQTSGNFNIKLTKGRWRISIRRGMEYLPVYHELEVNGRRKKIKREFVMKRWIDLPSLGWFSGDVHAHHALDKTSYWDYLFKLAEAEDVHLVNMLEMGDRKATYFKSDKYGRESRKCRGDICFAIGQEEPRSDYGHIIGLNIDTLARDTSQYNHYDVVFNKIHRAPQALVGFAHFAYRGEGVTKGMAYYMPAGNIDFVEMLQNTQINTRDYYDYLDMGFKLTATAGSDFPWGSTIGDGRTYVYTGNTFNPDAWFQGLKNGNSFVSNGPVIFMKTEGELPGSTLIRKKGDSIEINVEAICHPAVGNLIKLQLIGSDGIIAESADVSNGTMRINKRWQINKSQWVVASAWCDNEAVAHTSPVYIHVEGKNHLHTSRIGELATRQMHILDQIVKDENGKMQPDKGVLERVEAARKYYETLSRAGR